MSNLSEKKCQPCRGETEPLKKDEIDEYLKQLKGWSYQEEAITKTFEFKNYYETTAFVNAVVWIAHREDHHPDITFGYKKCQVDFMTHKIGGLSENDFIIAAKVDELFVK